MRAQLAYGVRFAVYAAQCSHYVARCLYGECVRFTLCGKLLHLNFHCGAFAVTCGKLPY